MSRRLELKRRRRATMWIGPIAIVVGQAAAAQADTLPQQTGLTAWLTADTGVVTSGTNVTQWTDQSGNGNSATGVGNYPSLVNNALNGLPAVEFSDPVDHLNLPTTAGSNLNIANGDYEIFIVSRSSNSGTQFMASGGFSGGVNEYGIQLNGGLGARFIPSSTATTDGTHDVYGDLGVAGEFTDGRTHIVDARVQSNIGILRVSGMENGDTVLNARSAYSNVLTLGVRGNGTLSYVGDMGEVLVYNHALSDSERRSVEQYLARKWNAPINVASQTQGGVAFANEVISGGTNPNHQISHLNDALYGNAHSWLGNNTGASGAFAGVKFDGAFDISSLAFGRDATGSIGDRSIGTYTFQYTLDDFDPNNPASIAAAQWFNLTTVTYDGSTSTPWLRHQYDFSTILGVRGVRVQLSSDALAIDELEVYGLASVPEPTSAIALTLAAAAVVPRRRRRC